MKNSDNIKFWLSDDVFNENIPEEVRRNIFRSSLKDFVKIVVGKDIPVNYSGDRNFTDGKSITIQEYYSKEILDTLVGVVLHESCHIKLSDFDLFKTLWMKIPRDIIEKSKSKGVKTSDLNDVYKKILNYVEDRFIDNWAYQSYIGYRSYYLSLYEDFWNNDEIGNVLESDRYREENLNSYLFRIINLTNPKTDLEALKGLREIHKILNLPNINRLKTPKDRLSVSEDILRKIIDSLEDPRYNKSQCECYKKCADQLDGGYAVKETKNKNQEEKIKKEERFYDSLEDIKKTECVVIKRLTNDIISSKYLPITSYGNAVKFSFGETFLSRGIELGKLLASKWKIRTESNSLISQNQRDGKINKRKVHLFETGEERLFYRKTSEFYKRTHIHISIDGSGSMSDDGGSKWKNAIIYSVAIAKAGSLTENVEVSISIRTTVESAGKTIPCLVFAYDSRFDNFSKIIENFPKLHPGGETPEGLTFFEISKNIPSSDYTKDTFFINFSDGMPSVVDLNFRGIEARNKTRQEYKKMKSNLQLKSMCYYIGESQEEYESFKLMYERDSFWIEPENILSISKTITGKILENKKVL